MIVLMGTHSLVTRQFIQARHMLRAGSFFFNRPLLDPPPNECWDKSLKSGAQLSDKSNSGIQFPPTELNTYAIRKN